MDGSYLRGPGILHPHLLPGENGTETRRASVVIGNHQQIGATQTKRVSVPIGSQQIGTAQLKREELRLGCHLSHGSKE